MRLTQLRSFHAVAVEQGFTRAAKRLHVSQPTVTSQVRMLEESYGVQLFHRHGNSVSLTPLGEQLLKLSRQMVLLETEAVQLLRDSGELKQGDLRIASVGPQLVRQMLVDFNKLHPGVRVYATIGNSREVIARLLDYRADIGVLAQPLQDERFVSIPLGRHDIVIFTSIDHPFAGRKSLRVADLQGQRLILRESGSTSRAAFEAGLAKAGVQVEVVMECGSRELIRECVLNDLGIAAVSRIEYLPDPRLHMLAIGDADLHIDTHVLCLRERREARLVQAFLDTARPVLKRRSNRPAAPRR